MLSDTSPLTFSVKSALATSSDGQLWVKEVMIALPLISSMVAPE